MRTVALAALASVLVGCYGEFDVPKTPRHDPCTQTTDNQYVYLQPSCPNPPPRNPHDLDYESHGFR